MGISIALQGEAVTPQATGAVSRLPAKDRSVRSRRAPMLYSWLAEAWEFDEASGEWLPQIRDQKVIGGVAGVPAQKKGRPLVDHSLRHIYAMKGGGVLDPVRDPRVRQWVEAAGVKPASLMQQHTDSAGNTIYVSIFESFSVHGQRVRWSFNREAYNDFRRHLVAQEVVTPIHPAVKRDLIARERKSLESTISKLGAAPADEGLRERVLKQKARLRAMEQGVPVSDALDALLDEMDKPAARRGRKGAK